MQWGEFHHGVMNFSPFRQSGNKLCKTSWPPIFFHRALRRRNLDLQSPAAVFSRGANPLTLFNRYTKRLEWSASEEFWQSSARESVDQSTQIAESVRRRAM